MRLSLFVDLIVESHLLLQSKSQTLSLIALVLEKNRFFQTGSIQLFKYQSPAKFQNIPQFFLGQEWKHDAIYLVEINHETLVKYLLYTK